MSNRTLVSLEGIRFAYKGSPLLFDDLCFSLHDGEQIGLYGPNGSGKTTLLRLITGLESPQSGRLLLCGFPVTQRRDFHRLRCTVGFVLQNSDEQLFSSTVLEDVAFGPLNLGMNRPEARDRAMETLEHLGIVNLADRPIHRLSGGEKKMAALASVLSMHPRALLLDEPTTFLDDVFKKRIIALLQRESIARVVVSHDKQFLKQVTSTFLTVSNGTVSIIAL